jgi:hypothetical protein
MREIHMSALTKTARTHLEYLLLLRIWLSPNRCSMSTKGKQKTDDVGEEQQSRCKPGVGLHGFIVKAIVERWGL